MSIAELAAMLRKSWWRIAIGVLIGASAGLGWALTQPRLYTASASAIVTAGAATDVGSATIADQFAQARVQSYLDMVQSRTVAEEVIRTLGLKTTPAGIVGRITGTVPPSTAVMRIHATSTSPQAAHDLADAWVKGLIHYVAKIESLQSPGHYGTSIVQMQPLESAALPNFPSSPHYKTAVMYGAGVGLVLGFALSFMLFKLDMRVRSARELEETFGVPVIGSLPFNSELNDGGRGGSGRTKQRNRKAEKENRLLSEAYRKLRTNLQFMNVDNPPRRIVITSSLPNEGKSTTTVHLAQALAESGQRVVVIDGDLRRRGLAQAFGVVEGPGLTDVLVHRVDVQDVLQPVGRTGLLQILSAGMVPPNPSELLGSNAFQTLLDQLAEDAMVIIDAPPLLPVTDAAILAARTDGAILLARAGSTTIGHLKIAMNNLARINGKALGMVLNRVPRAKASGSYYGYSYYGDYYGDYYGEYYGEEPVAKKTRVRKPKAPRI